MKTLSLLTILAASLLFTISVQAQSSGRWGTCRDPNGTGQLVKCWIPLVNSRPIQRVETTQRIYVTQRIYITERVVQKPRSYSPAKSATYPSIPATHVPIYQTQQLKSEDKGCTGGFYRFPQGAYGECHWSTGKKTLVVTTNSETFRPDIRIDNNGYSYPNYRRWYYDQ
jgi:hypothetical protein